MRERDERAIVWVERHLGRRHGVRDRDVQQRRVQR